MTKFTVVSSRSQFSLDGRSSLHPVHTSTNELAGYLEAEMLADGKLNLAAPVSGRLEVTVENMKSGNELYDLEMRRRLDTRRYPTIVAQLVQMCEANGGGCRVVGDLSFHGVTRRVEGNLTVTQIDDRTLDVSGEQSFDMRDFGVNPPSLLGMKVYPDIRALVKLIAERVD